jgi:hypothetical protein
MFLPRASTVFPSKGIMVRRRQNTESEETTSEITETESLEYASIATPETGLVEASPPPSPALSLAPTTYIVTKRARFIYNGIHTLPAGLEVHEHTHDLAAMREQGIEMVPKC